MRGAYPFLAVRSAAAFATFTLALILLVEALCESRPDLCRCSATTVFLPPRQAP